MKQKLEWINRISQWCHKRFDEPVAFLRAGQGLGILLCTCIAAYFLSESVIHELLIHMSGITAYLISFFIIVLACEVVSRVLKLLLGSGKTDRVYGYVAFGIITANNLMATRGVNIPVVVLMSLLVALALNLVGRCILGFIKTKNYKHAWGYAMLILSAGYLMIYGYVCVSDSFGEDRVALYMEKQPANPEGLVEGFQEYLSDGEEDIGIMTYGPGSEYDISTATIDMMNVVERKGFVEKVLDMTCKSSFLKTPISGIIYYPQNTYNCPTLFIVHGAHNANTLSYLGYDYLGEYLASNGYVVVSVDENIVNELNESNDIRAILLLENIKAILEENHNSDSKLYGRINDDKLALGGHSRGGEMVATAYLFNDLSTYPENGNVEFDYHFNISSIIAIAPTVDQYTPADHSVMIENVDYLLIHGANDHDVNSVMGEKQYSNVLFTGEDGEDYCKASVYILGANHGQFNSQWGRYDLSKSLSIFLNTAHFISQEEQQLIAKAYIRTFLDMSLLEKETYSDILIDNTKYRTQLPRTVYITNYKDSYSTDICSFDDSYDLDSMDVNGVSIYCEDMREWSIGSSVYGNGTDEENYVLQCEWREGSTPRIAVDFPAVNLETEYIAFRIKDMMGGDKNRVEGVDYNIELTDVLGHSVTVNEPTYIYPKLGIQLYKQDVLSGSYEYKHQFQTVIVNKELFDDDSDFDFGNVVQMNIVFNGGEKGRAYIDDIYTAADSERGSLD